MNYTLDWQASRLASCLHAAEAVAQGRPLANSTLAPIISEPLLRLAEELQNNHLPAEAFWQRLLDLSLQASDVSRLVEQALDHHIYSNLSRTAVSHIGGLVNEIVAAVLLHLGDIDALLKLRTGPIRQQWEARGPGMMRRISALSHEPLVLEKPVVVLVLPATGGGGGVHPKQNSVRFEAVLTDTLGQLPEVARLTWLVTRLALRRAEHDETHSPNQSPIVELLVALPLVLAAAEYVELVRFDEPTLVTAVKSWIPSAESPTSLASIAHQWWKVFAESQLPVTNEMKRLGALLLK